MKEADADMSLVRWYCRGGNDRYPDAVCPQGVLDSVRLSSPDLNI